MKASEIGLVARLSIGEPKAFVGQIFAVASLLTLISASIALTNMPRTTILAYKVYDAYVSVILDTIGEVLNILRSWNLVVWILVFAAVYVLSLHSLEEFTPTARLLIAIGFSRFGIVRLLLARMILIGAIGCLVGSCGGLVLSQLSFRAMAYISNAPYEIPVLTFFDLFLLLSYAVSAVLAGGVIPTLKFERSIGK